MEKYRSVQYELLRPSEVKSLRSGSVNLKDSYETKTGASAFGDILDSELVKTYLK